MANRTTRLIMLLAHSAATPQALRQLANDFSRLTAHDSLLRGATAQFEATPQGQTMELTLPGDTELTDDLKAAVRKLAQQLGVTISNVAIAP